MKTKTKILFFTLLCLSLYSSFTLHKAKYISFHQPSPKIDLIPLMSLEESKEKSLIDKYGTNNSHHLRSEINKIVHFSNEAKIVIYLKNIQKDRICKTPRVFGRLSGKFLSLIYWENDARGKIHGENLTTTNKIIGYYSVPIKGKYYIEIIGLLCNDFPYHANFRNICLENVEYNHLTSSSASIEVSTTNKKCISCQYSIHLHLQVHQMKLLDIGNGLTISQTLHHFKQDTKDKIVEVQRHQKRNA